MQNILEVENLSVQFEDANEPTIDRLSFVLPRGEHLAVIGPNGSGKTVLLRALLGTTPHEGLIRWAPNIRLGYVPQKIEADRHLPMDLHNLLEAKAKILKVPHHELAEVLKIAGITKTIQKTPIGHLSGGEFQKALIAFALLGKPDVILFDEPTASLDAPREEQAYELIHRLQDEMGITVILVSHDLSVVYRYSTQVLCLNKRNICFGEPEKVLTPEILSKLYSMPLTYYHHLHDTHEHH